MTIQSLIYDLKRASKPNRRIDIEIAEALKFKEVAEEGAGGKRTVWENPFTGERGKLPWFTSSIDEARALLTSVWPTHVAAVKVEDGVASAIIDGGPSVEASTPALALCLALFSAVAERQATLKPQ